MQSLCRKVCILGAPSVGKTSLVRSFVYGTFDKTQTNTAGIQVSRKTIAVLQQGSIIEITLLLWDTNYYRQLKLAYPNALRNIDGAILVCDIEHPRSLYCALAIFKAIHKYSPNAKVSVAINKIDLLTNPPDTLNKQITLRKQVQNAFSEDKLPTFLISAKSGANIENLFRHMGQSLITDISALA